MEGGAKGKRKKMDTETTNNKRATVAHKRIKRSEVEELSASWEVQPEPIAA